MTPEAQIIRLTQRLDDFEQYVRERLEAGDKRMDNLATREDIAVIHRTLVDGNGNPRFVDKEAMARLNNIVYNFTLAAEVLQTGGKWIYRLVVGLAAFIGALSILSNGFRSMVMGIIHSFWVGN